MIFFLISMNIQQQMSNSVCLISVYPIETRNERGRAFFRSRRALSFRSHPPITGTEAGAEVIFTDKCTGTKMVRPEFDKLLSAVQSGDELIACKLDRFARTAAEGSLMVQDLASARYVRQESDLQDRRR